MKDIELNKNGVNAAITATILPEEEMRRIGFTDFNEDFWFFSRGVVFPKDVRYRNFDITFNVTIPKDGSDIRIDILDDEWMQPYDYQGILGRNSTFEPCVIIDEQVESWMKYLQDKGVLAGHVKGEYI